MSQQFPETSENIEAKEGEASHEIGSRLIMNQTTGYIKNLAENTVGETATNGVVFTDEMFEAAEIYANDVGEVMRSTGVFGGENFGNEHKMKAPNIHDQSFGTDDQFIFDQNTGNLYVWDYKFGFEIVEVFENWQMINYVEGIAEQLDLLKNAEHITVHFRVVQPRAIHRDGQIREWIVRLVNLRAQFNVLHTNAHIALSDQATTRSGSHCKHCTARHACPAALQAGLRLYEVVSMPTPLELSPEAVGIQLTIIKRARKQLEYLESGFDEQVKNLIIKGINVQGWQVERGFGREKWAKPVNEVITMGNLLGHDLKKQDEAITPVQARNKGVDDAMISIYSVKPETGLKLTPDNGNKAKLIFNS